jgi:hypothetical protein
MVFSKEETRWRKQRQLKNLIQFIKNVGACILKTLQKDKMDSSKNTEVKGVNLLIIRDTFTDKSTIGKLFLNGEMFCDTLELPYLDNQRRISCIPEGEYPVRIRLPRESATRDYMHLLVKDVPNRDYILFHIGNFPRDTKGCVLVAQSRKQDAVYNSTLAMDLLMKEILNLGGTNINLIIKNK